jgi:DNA-directed RNA polymerase specialized sigma24 family protein
VVRRALADAGVRRRIEEIVRRRVRPDAVEDVLHQVACDALASHVAPEDPAEVPRWLFAVTRNKVADHHRTCGRRAEAPLDPGRLVGRPAPLEARSLLRQVIADASRHPRGAETMRWIAREADGERLDEVAREAALPPATVRQRVSRMRRWLRKRWLHEALLVAAAGLVAVLVLCSRAPRATIPIVADPLDDPRATAAAALEGQWRVVRVEPDAALDPARRALVNAEALSTVVQVTGSALALTSATRHAQRRLEVGVIVAGRFELRIIDGGGNVERATASLDAAGELVVVSNAGAWRGRVVLAR